MSSVFDVAKYILELFKDANDLPITTWKLQKLVYYSQAWSLVWDDEPLFEERIEAWANGPVCPDLYQAHKGQLKINDLAQGNIDQLTDEQRETIEVVYASYGDKTPQYLSALTHQEAPWLEARGKTPPGERSTAEITTESMTLFYGGL